MGNKKNNELRQHVYAKCNGHCAYCGCEISIKEMQVDHIVPMYRGWDDYTLNRFGGVRGTNDIDNLMPACRQCNFYKGTNDLEDFRRLLSTMMERVRKPFIFRLAEKYGLVREVEWDGKFYFER